jgi:hypothetical protein
VILGEILYPCGTVYKGVICGQTYPKFRQDCIGVLTYFNGDMYTGEFESMPDDNDSIFTEPSLKSGCGVLRYVNGDLFNGIWSQDFIHGQGTFTFVNNDVFFASWIQNKPGQGRFISALTGQTQVCTF